MASWTRWEVEERILPRKGNHKFFFEYGLDAKTYMIEVLEQEGCAEKEILTKFHDLLNPEGVTVALSLSLGLGTGGSRIEIYNEHLKIGLKLVGRNWNEQDLERVINSHLSEPVGSIAIWRLDGTRTIL